MGRVVRPIRPSNAEIDRRIAAGGRTVGEIDPGFAHWAECRRAERVGMLIAVGVAVVAGAVYALWAWLALAAGSW